jgi:ATP-binding protein involved in chromosome partitioning
VQQQQQDSYSLTAASHAASPANYGRMPHAQGRARITGPCGDTMEVWLQVREGRIRRASFITDGCGPSLASGSMATELATGRPIEEALTIGQQQVLEALGGLPADVEHCALLAADTLQGACRDYLDRPPDRPSTEPATAGQSDPQQRQSESKEELADRQKLERRLERIRHKVLVLSGKGGVGKSTVAVNLAVALVRAGRRVGLLDVDVHGPTVPTMLHLEGEPVLSEGQELLPVEVGELKVMSVGFLLQRREDAVIWRGPMKMGVIKQFLKDVQWGDLDYLIVDAPPGTGDEPLSVCQLVGPADGALIVTTPQEVALASVRKCISFCRQLGLRVLGVVENMSGFLCPHCGNRTDIFLAGGGRQMAEEMRVGFLSSIPLDPRVTSSGDAGRPTEGMSPQVSKAFEAILGRVLDEEPAAAVAGPAESE